MAWKVNEFFETGFAWKTEDNKTQMLIHRGQFEDWVVGAWKSSPHKSILRRTFGNLNKARSFAKHWRTKNPNG